MHSAHAENAHAMNVQLANVICDINGVTGMVILRTIVAGECDPVRLSTLKHNRVRASRREIAGGLEGNWREELVFDLSVLKIAVCDQRIEQHLKTMTSKPEPVPTSGPATLHPAKA